MYFCKVERLHLVGPRCIGSQSADKFTICSVGNSTRRLHWEGGSLEDLCAQIVDLFHARDASSFFSGQLPVDMGLFLVHLCCLEGHTSCERVVDPQQQLQPGCVLEVLLLRIGCGVLNRLQSQVWAPEALFCSSCGKGFVKHCRFETSSGGQF